MSEPSNRMIELELTYLAKKLPDEVKNIKPEKLFDLYLPENAYRPTMRLRQKGKSYEITKKKPINLNDFSRQTEQTIPLDKDEFAALAVVSKRKVVKDRYTVTIDGTTAEVDVFGDDLHGLVLIDFEFETDDAKSAFRPPDCCLADVTQEFFLAGGQLAGKSYADILVELDRFGYKALSL